MQTVDDFLAGLDGETRRMVDAFRSIITEADPRLTESIKWNAPSYALGAEDRITLGLERTGGVRMVLHRGSKSRPEDGFVFADPAGLARWPAPDRGVVTIKTLASVEARRPELRALCEQWIARTS